MNIFDCAIKTEQNAKACYERLEKESGHKNLFSLLAAAEQQHIDTLMGMKDAMGGNGAEVASCEPGELDMAMKNDPDFFQHAVRGEERDIRYYEELAAQVEDAGVRLNLLLIAEEERKHLEVVENIYSYAQAPDNYLVAPEFGNLDEL